MRLFILVTTSVVRSRFYTSVLSAVAWHPLRDLEPASESEFFPGRRGRDRSQELEQIHKAVAAFGFETDAQRQRQGLLVQRRHEAGANLFPKRTLDEAPQPPLTPPLEGAAVDSQVFTQALHPFGLQALRHGRNQYHHQPGINSSPQETHGGWSLPPPTALLGATQAKAQLPVRTTPRLARIIAAVQLAK